MFGGGWHGLIRPFDERSVRFHPRLRCKFQIVNTGFRGHQFVKEGAEEVLARGLSPNGSTQLLVNRRERFYNRGLCIRIGIEYRQALHHAIVEVGHDCVRSMGIEPLYESISGEVKGQESIIDERFACPGEWEGNPPEKLLHS